MTHPISHNLTLTRKLLLAAAAIMAIAGPVLIGVLNAPQSRAQSKPEELTFEVASIRPNNSGSGSSRFDFGGQKLTATNTNLFRCIYFAYGLKEYQISGPDWLQSETYDIVAKAASPVPGSQLMVMLQALLAERFKLRTHRQTKELPIYALVVGKNGAKLKPAEPGPEHDSAERGRLSAQKISMPKLAEFLSKHLGRPVLDMTNLHGVFDLTLEWADERSAATDSASAPSLFSAVQQQLGLKLEARKGPVEILIVDHAEKVPTEN